MNETLLKQQAVVAKDQGRVPHFAPIDKVKRGDWLVVLDFFDRAVFARVTIVEPPTGHDQQWRLWVAPVFRGDEVVSRMSFDTCEEIEVWS